MYTLNGFGNVAPLAINTVGVVAPIGELSTRSETYSKEIGTYALPAYKDVTLVSFLSTEDTAQVPVPTDIALQVLTVMQYLWDRTVAGQKSNDRDQILADLLATYQTEANSFDCGVVMSDAAGRYFLPEWLSWQNNAYDAGQNFIKVYFSDQSFQIQYDKFSITPVYPFANIDDFFLAPALVKNNLAARTNAQLALDIETAKGIYPETILWGETYDYVSPLDHSTTPANFNALIYGAAGNNLDSIKEAITSAILAASTHTRDEWVAILPDLFKRTEFILTPIWDNYALPDSAQQSGIYSPGSLLTRSIEIALQTAYGYPQIQVNMYLEQFGHPYKSLAMLSVGGPENRNGVFRFSQIFPDYINVGAGTPDYSRMGKYTTDFLYQLAVMLPIAETMTAYSDIPRGLTRQVRGTIMYLVCTYDKIQYLLVAKQSFAAITPTP